MASGSAAHMMTSATCLALDQNTEGKIFIEPQGICIMAGIGVEDGNASKALNSVENDLATPHGIVLQQPAFINIICTWAKFHLIRPGTRKMPAFSATPIHGS